MQAAPALAFPFIRLRIVFASKVLYGRPPRSFLLPRLVYAPDLHLPASPWLSRQAMKFAFPADGLASKVEMMTAGVALIPLVSWYNRPVSSHEQK